MIRLARGRFDEARHLADDRAFGKPFRRLPDDSERLAELFHPDQVAVVRVARRADGDVEVHLVVGGVRLVLPDVPRHAGPAQRRTAHPKRRRLRPADDAHALRPLEPDAIVRQQRLVLVELAVHDLAELEDLLVPAGRDVQRQPADAHRVVREARAAELLEQIQDQLALAERVEEHRHRADVHRVRADPETVTRDALQLAEDRPDVAGAPRHFELEQLLHRLAVADVARGSRHVIHAVRQQDDLRPVAVLAQLLDAAMEISHHDVRVDDLFAVEAQHHAQHAVRAGMLRPHVDHELVRVEHRAVDRLRLQRGHYSMSASSRAWRSFSQSSGFSIRSSPGPSSG